MERPANGDDSAKEGAGGEDDAFSGLPIPAKGTLLLGKYRVEGVVGIGGMGMVIAARHEHLNERVALKLLLPRFAELPEIRKRFQREAQAAYKLRSEHVCRVLDAGELPDGTPFIAMEYLKGDDLAAVIRKRKRIPPAEAVDFILQACDALAEAHANEVVHRDLKPANFVIITRKDGTPCLKVIDFGISKVSNETSDLTNTYGYLGSPSYSAPEQFASTRAMTASGDIWALGVILYEMIAGKLPFDFTGDSLAEMATTITYEPAVPLTTRDPSLSPDLDAVVLRCLEKDPTRRHARVRELAEALAPFASGPVDDLISRLTRIQIGAPPSPQQVALATGTAAVVAVPQLPVPATMLMQPGAGPSQPPSAPNVAAMSPMPMRQANPSTPPPLLGPQLGPQPPVTTRFSVAASAVQPTLARTTAWMPVLIAVIAVLSTFAAVFLYRAKHRAAAREVAAASATYEPVPVAMGTESAEPPPPAPAETAPPPATPTVIVPATPEPVAVPSATASAAPTSKSVTAPRPQPTTRPHHGPVTPAGGAPTTDQGPKILKDREGK